MIYFADFSLRFFLFFLKDVNECEGSNKCDHVCHNSVGSYYCSCKKGFVLAADKQQCIGNALRLFDLFISTYIQSLRSNPLSSDIN